MENEHGVGKGPEGEKVKIATFGETLKSKDLARTEGIKMERGLWFSR